MDRPSLRSKGAILVRLLVRILAEMARGTAVTLISGSRSRAQIVCNQSVLQVENEDGSENFRDSERMAQDSKWRKILTRF